jgi:hypothetical protein
MRKHAIIVIGAGAGGLVIAIGEEAEQTMVTYGNDQFKC